MVNQALIKFIFRFYQRFNSLFVIRDIAVNKTISTDQASNIPFCPIHYRIADSVPIQDSHIMQTLIIIMWRDFSIRPIFRFESAGGFTFQPCREVSIYANTVNVRRTVRIIETCHHAASCHLNACLPSKFLRYHIFQHFPEVHGITIPYFRGRDIAELLMIKHKRSFPWVDSHDRACVCTRNVIFA